MRSRPLPTDDINCSSIIFDTSLYVAFRRRGLDSLATSYSGVRRGPSRSDIMALRHSESFRSRADFFRARRYSASDDGVLDGHHRVYIYGGECGPHHVRERDGVRRRFRVRDHLDADSRYDRVKIFAGSRPLGRSLRHDDRVYSPRHVIELHPRRISGIMHLRPRRSIASSRFEFGSRLFITCGAAARCSAILAGYLLTGSQKSPGGCSARPSGKLAVMDEGDLLQRRLFSQGISRMWGMPRRNLHLRRSDMGWTHLNRSRPVGAFIPESRYCVST